MTIKNLKHVCKPHSFQDKKYGTKKRVFVKTNQEDRFRCTVCGGEQIGG